MAHTPPVSKYCRPGQALFKEGEASHSLFLLQKGTLSIRKMKGAAFVEIARVFAGEVIGELSFFDRNPRSASAVALTECEALEISFESLEKIYSSTPAYLKTIVACMAERLRRADDTIRRLQKDVVKEGAESAPTPDGGPSASEALSALSEVAIGAGGKLVKPEVAAEENPESAVEAQDTEPKKD